MSFIPIIINSKNLFSSESRLKYFLTQAIASSIFLFIIIVYFLFLNLKTSNLRLISVSLCSTIMLKIGAAPFHFWFPRVIEGLSWFTNFVLITWQKIAPLIIISYIINFTILMVSIFFAIIFGRLGGLNQTSLRKLIAFSSINHLGWIFAAIIFNQIIWTTYFRFYLILNLRIIFIFNNFKLINLRQTFSIFYSSPLIKLSLFITLLSLGGLPPFLGFFPKWIIIELIITKKIFLLVNFILFLTLISLYFYIRITYASVLLNHIKINWSFKNNLNKKNFLIIIICFISLFGIILINNLFFFI